MAYHYEQLTDDRIKDVQFLFREVFKYKVSEAYLKAKYNTAYSGKKHLCFLAYENNKPIAFYGALPYRFQYQNERFLAAHACDSITLPTHQRKGLHFELATRSYEVMQQNGLQFVFAMHSDNTFRATKKLEWLSTENMLRFHVKTGAIPHAKVAQKIGLNNQFQKRVKKALSAHLVTRSFENPLAKEGWMCTEYPTTFYDYKNFTPNHVIQIGATTFWVKAETVMMVGAFDSSSEVELEKSLIELKKCARKLGINELLFQVSRNTKQAQQLASLCEAKESWLIGYLNFSCEVPFEKFKLNYGDLDTF
jgi:hypothetical protein